MLELLSRKTVAESRLGFPRPWGPFGPPPQHKEWGLLGPLPRSEGQRESPAQIPLQIKRLA